MKRIFTAILVLFAITQAEAQNLDFGNTVGANVTNQGTWDAPGGAIPTWTGSSGRTPTGNRDQLRNLAFGPNIGFVTKAGISIPPGAVKMTIYVPVNFASVVAAGAATTYWSAGIMLPDTSIGGVTYQRLTYTLTATVPQSTSARAVMQLMTTTAGDGTTGRIYVDYTGIGSYTVINYNQASAYTAGLGVYTTVRSNNTPVLTADFNKGMVNNTVTGNMSANDYLPSGTSTYGSPSAAAGNPSGGTFSLNNDGSYTFTGTTAGTYIYTVPVTTTRGAGTITGYETISITLVDPKASNNAPVVAPDVVNTTTGTGVQIKSLANDAAGNQGGALNPASVAVSTVPANGTYSVNSSTGDITYTPNAGFTGKDSLKYTVCDNATPTPFCGSAWQYISVETAGLPNRTVANDDNATTLQNTAVSGNVKTNDKDPDGSVQNVTAQTSTIPGKGTLVLAADGTYTFTPAGNFTGPVDFPYTTCNSVVAMSPGQDCSGASLHILVLPNAPQPDANASLTGVPVKGNVSTNDNVPPGTTYGTPVAAGSNPSGVTMTMNPDGTYTFTGTTPGIYIYNVPVCPPGQSTGCPATPLTITVTDGVAGNNPPVVIPDLGIVTQNNSGVATKNNVVVKTLANDAAGNPGGSLNPASVTLVSGPSHGTVSIAANGDITYTPTDGYSGNDVLTYRVCDNSTPAPLCGSATQTFSVMPADTTGTPTTTNTFMASDDFAVTVGTATTSGNVLTNDKGTGALTVTNPGTTTIPGKGTFTLNSNGTYSFVPVPGFSGTVDLPYTAKDANGSTAAATLHVEVKPFELNPDFTVTMPGVPVSGSVKTNDNVPDSTPYGIPVANGGNPTTTIPTMNPDGTYTFTESTPGVYTYTVPACPVGQSTGCPTSSLTITVNNPTATTNKPILNPDVVTTKGAPTSPSSVTVNVKANDAPGNSGGVLGTPTIPGQPVHGTASVDGSGNVVYTPTAGYYGPDVVTYQVCEPQSSSNCNTTTLTITVVAPDATDLMAASDDFVATVGTTTASGNVLTNDLGTGALTVINPGTTTIPGKGTFTLNSNGTYNFVPVSGFNGTVDLPYTAKDASGNTGTATLHVTVKSDLGIVVKAKVFLEGAYKTATSNMTNVLNDPGTQILAAYALNNPYNNTFFGMNNGTERVAASVFTSHPNIVDWVLLEVRSPTDYKQVLARRGAFVLRDGTIVDTGGSNNAVAFPAMKAGNYYLSVSHRNHLTVISSSAIALGATGTEYDFTTALNKAMDNGNGNSMKKVGSIWAMWGGDYNHDHVIDQLDNSYLNTEVRQGYLDEYHTGDFFFDGFVDQVDKAAFFNFNKTAGPVSPLF